MRRKQTESNVRTITTGNAEADMLGQVYLWVSERSNRLNAQRSHRKTYKKRQPKSIFRVAVECIQTAPSAYLRRLKAWQDKKDARVPKYLSGLRKDKRNGK